jgi:hypothetical protein
MLTDVGPLSVKDGNATVTLNVVEAVSVPDTPVIVTG